MDEIQRKEWMLELQKKHPKILAQLGGDVRKTCMSWGHGGIAVGEGWFPIIEALCDRIQGHIDHVQKGIDNDYPYAKDWKPVPQVVFEQVKEKFGELRIYYSGGDDYIEGLYSMAVSMSVRICESCGKPGHTRTDGWIVVLCDDCNNKRGK